MWSCIDRQCEDRERADGLAKEKARGALNYGSSGIGGFVTSPASSSADDQYEDDAHPVTELGAFVTDLISGQIQVLFKQHDLDDNARERRTLRAIATTGAKRSPALPDLPHVPKRAGRAMRIHRGRQSQDRPECRGRSSHGCTKISSRS